MATLTLLDSDVAAVIIRLEAERDAARAERDTLREESRRLKATLRRIRAALEANDGNTD